MQQKAFSLIELIIVIAIIGLLTALLIPAVMGTQKAHEITATQGFIGSLMVAFKAQKIEVPVYPLPDNQQSTTKGDPGYLIGVLRYDRSDTNPGIINRFANLQKFAFDTEMFLSDDNILTDPWGTPIHYVRGDALNGKNKSGYDNTKPQDLNKPKDGSVAPADSDWNILDEPGYPYIYSEGPDFDIETWIYQKD